MKRTNLQTIVAGLIWIALATLGRAADIWIAPDGDDHNAGTKEQPLATMSMAQRKARELRRLGQLPGNDPVRLMLHGGTYRLTEPVWFRSEDSGTPGHETIVMAAPGEQPVLSGAVSVTGWRRAQEAAGLTEAARGNVFVSDAPRFAGRPLFIRQLWVADRKAIRARSPNGDAMSRLTGWDRANQTATIPATDLGAVREPGSLELVVEQQWEIAMLRVRGIERAGANARLTFAQPESRIEFEHPWPQPILPPKGGGAFYLVNALEFLDEPGEWFQDGATGRIYYWPREGEDLSRGAVSAPALPTLLQIEGSLDRPVMHLQFQGIAFAHSAWTRPSTMGHVPLQAGMPLTEAYKLSPAGTPDKKSLENQAWIGRMAAAVRASGAAHVRFERCRFEHLAASALDFVRGVRDSSVEGCRFSDVGGNGVQLGSFQEGGVETHVPYAPGDERELCERVRIANNLVTDTANEDWGGVGIIAGYARGIAIEHNEISHTSYTGISVGWGWTRTANATRENRIHANLLHHVATRVCDTAGIYTLSAQPGTVVSENVVRDIAMSPYVDRPDHWFYLYTDEGSSGITVRDNWCPAEKFLKNANGPGNVWENNGPMVSDKIKAAAGLEPAFRDLLRIP